MKNPAKALLPILCVAALSLVGCSSGPGTTYANCTKSIANGETEKAVACFDPSMMQKPGVKEKMASMVAMAAAKAKEQHKGVESVTVTEEKIEGDKATVKIHVKFGDGTEEDDSGSLARVNGKWYVLN